MQRKVDGKAHTFIFASGLKKVRTVPYIFCLRLVTVCGRESRQYYCKVHHKLGAVSIQRYTSAFSVVDQAQEMPAMLP